MNRIAVIFAIVGGLAFVAPSARADGTAIERGAHAIPLLSAEHAAKIREEVRINEGRARELEPIIARDRQARNDVEADWKVLERHAKDLHARAVEFRSIANVVGGRGQQELTNYANDFDVFATHDEENARFKHEVAERLDKNIQGEVAARDWHLKTAQRLRDWLAANGG